MSLCFLLLSNLLNYNLLVYSFLLLAMLTQGMPSMCLLCVCYHDSLFGGWLCVTSCFDTYLGY